MERRRIPFTIGLVLGAFCASSQASELSLEQHDRGITVRADGELFTEYLIKTGPKPILWPIIGPSGKPMTRAFPMQRVEGEKFDHPHQRSLWFTHGNVNGVDFWSEFGRHGSIVHREFTRFESGTVAVIQTKNDWLGPDGKRQCEDERTLSFRVDKDRRTIDFQIVIRTSDGPVQFGDTKEGTFGIRVPTLMDVDRKAGGRIVTSEGLTDAAAWGQRAAWVDYHGPIDGQMVGIAVMNHPSSFRYPTYWHVRTYGLFAANPFGVHDFVGSEEANGSYRLEAGGELVLRYRVLLHAGDAAAADVAKAFAEYSAETIR